MLAPVGLVLKRLIWIEYIDWVAPFLSRRASLQISDIVSAVEMKHRYSIFLPLLVTMTLGVITAVRTSRP